MPRTKNASKKGRKGGIATATSPSKVNPVTAGLLGAIAGAAVGATAGVVLSNEKTRKNVVDAVGSFSDKANEYTQQGAKKVKEFRGKAANVMDKAQKQLSDTTPTQGVKGGMRTKKAKR